MFGRATGKAQKRRQGVAAQQAALEDSDVEFIVLSPFGDSPAAPPLDVARSLAVARPPARAPWIQQVLDAIARDVPQPSPAAQPEETLFSPASAPDTVPPSSTGVARAPDASLQHLGIMQPYNSWPTSAAPPRGAEREASSEAPARKRGSRRTRGKGQAGRAARLMARAEATEAGSGEAGDGDGRGDGSGGGDAETAAAAATATGEMGAAAAWAEAVGA